MTPIEDPRSAKLDRSNAVELSATESQSNLLPPKHTYFISTPIGRVLCGVAGVLLVIAGLIMAVLGANNILLWPLAMLSRFNPKPGDPSADALLVHAALLLLAAGVSLPLGVKLVLLAVLTRRDRSSSL